MSGSGAARHGYAAWPRWLRWSLELSLFALVFLGVYSWQTRDLLPVDATQPAPPLSGPLLDGGRLDLQQLGGRPALVYFFAPWCRVCAFSASSLQDARARYGQEQVTMVMVALSYESVASVQRFRDEHGLSIPVLLGDAHTAERWNIYGFPTYYVIDADGHIVSRDFGVSTGAGLRLRLWKAGAR